MMQTTRFVVFQLADFLLFFFSGKYLILTGGVSFVAVEMGIADFWTWAMCQSWSNQLMSTGRQASKLIVGLYIGLIITAYQCESIGFTFTGISI